MLGCTLRLFRGEKRDEMWLLQTVVKGKPGRKKIACCGVLCVCASPVCFVYLARVCTHARTHTCIAALLIVIVLGAHTRRRPSTRHLLTMGSCCLWAAVQPPCATGRPCRCGQSPARPSQHGGTDSSCALHKLRMARPVPLTYARPPVHASPHSTITCCVQAAPLMHSAAVPLHVIQRLALC